MTVYDLSEEQIQELKQAYFYSDETQDVLEEMKIMFPDDIPDDIIFNYYDGVWFVNDDFFCSCGKDDESK